MHSKEGKNALELCPMPIYRFKNADNKKCAELEELIDLLFKPVSQNPNASAVTDNIVYAHMCNIYETMINSFELKRLCPLDPIVLKKIQEKLDDCR